jgi:chaperone LolA
MPVFLLSLIFGVLACAQPAPDTSAILKGVEQRYNSTKTLEAHFTLNFKDRGRPRAPESGTLYLSKPNRTRWDYTDGNFFLADGKYTYEYDKAHNSVDRVPFKETEDTRIPLSFLLGNLNFDRDFERITAKREGENTALTLEPRNKKLAFSEITILVAPDYSIHRVQVVAQSTVMEYVLEDEKRNIKLPESLFKFTPPPGAKVSDLK